MDLILNGKIGQSEINNAFINFTQNKANENKDSSRHNVPDLDDLFSMKSSKMKSNSKNNSKASFDKSGDLRHEEVLEENNKKNNENQKEYKEIETK